MRKIEKIISLRILDMLWMDHLDNMEHLRDSVRLRAYGQQDPLVEYKNEGHKMFRQLLETIETSIAQTILKVSLVPKTTGVSPINSPQNYEARPRNIKKKVGRNDPCPCGAKHPDGRPVKYKHCHGRNV